MSIAVGLSATKTGFDLIKGVRELVRRPDIDAGEVSARLLDLQDLMLDARTALTEAQEEKTQLEARIAELSRMAEFGKGFVSEYGVYWYMANPYCPTCWDVDRKPVRLAGPKRAEQAMPGMNAWTCPFHKAEFMFSYQAPSKMREKLEPEAE
jgi:hypothetical protein